MTDPPRIRNAGRARHGRARTERYRLPTLWCLHLYTYHAELEIDGHPVTIRPGLLTLVSPDTPTVYRYRRDDNEHAYVHFEIEPTRDPQNTRAIPLAIALGPEAPAFRRQLDRIIGTRTAQSRQADALLWTLLWDLATRSAYRSNEPSDRTLSAVAELPPVLSEAVAYIDAHLHRPLRVADLAQHVGLSHNHLTRQFRAHLNQTVAGFLRQQRIDRAKHLLRETDRPAAAIACDVGLPDLQQFNKTFRRETGLAPTRWRSTNP
ncbi:MAG: AraC family transcriptional regulator [Planctomycetota bacterium]